MRATDFEQRAATAELGCSASQRYFDSVSNLITARDASQSLASRLLKEVEAAKVADARNTIHENVRRFSFNPFRRIVTKLQGHAAEVRADVAIAEQELLKSALKEAKREAKVLSAQNTALAQQLEAAETKLNIWKQTKAIKGKQEHRFAAKAALHVSCTSHTAD